jgi:phosphatidate cytidylyltransferase
MSYLDESEYDDRARDGRSGDGRPRDDRSGDDRSRDGRGSGGRRSTQPARPAWDAATYGTPEDLRRSRPPASSRGRGSSPDHGYADGGSTGGSDPYRSPSSADPYPADPSWTSPYQPDPYAASPYAASPYETEPYVTEPYTTEPYTTEPYTTEPHVAEPHPAEPIRSPSSYLEDLYPAATSANPYAPEAYVPDAHVPDTYAAARYAPDPYPAGSFSSGPYPANKPSSGSPDPDPYRVDPATGGWSSARRDRGDGSDPAQRYPGGLPSDDADAHADARQPSAGRAGRNLPAAIGVGVLLGAIAVASLFVWRPAFLGVLAVAVGVGIWEMVRAIRGSGANPPLIPLVAGGGLMMGLAWWGHADALTFGLMVTVLAAMVWRLADGSGNYGRDITAATLVAVYVPFLAGFAALLATPADGDLRVLVTLAGVVLSDTGGYIAGVLFGRHAMAPSVSPKKSWEGLAGSLVATGVGGALLLYFLFHVSFVWGAVFGVAVSVAAVLGDLGESMIKRDLGVKDMSQLLPGHGGLMDRLDSIVFAAPIAYVLLVLLAPPI